MIRRPPRSTRTDTLFPYTTLFRSALAAREQVAAAPGEALAIFKQAQFLGGVDQYVRIAADPIAPVRRDEIPGREYSVTQIGLGDRAEARDRAALCHGGAFGGRPMGRVDQAPRPEARRVGKEWVRTWN